MDLLLEAKYQFPPVPSTGNFSSREHPHARARCGYGACQTKHILGALGPKGVRTQERTPRRR